MRRFDSDPRLHRQMLMEQELRRFGSATVSESVSKPTTSFTTRQNSTGAIHRQSPVWSWRRLHLALKRGGFRIYTKAPLLGLRLGPEIYDEDVIEDGADDLSEGFVIGVF